MPKPGWQFIERPQGDRDVRTGRGLGLAVSPCLLATVCLAMNVRAATDDVPAGTRFQIRLISGVSTRTARVGDPVSAVLVVDVPVNDRILPAGAVLRGTVAESTSFSWRDPQAILRLAFDALIVGGDRSIPLSAKVVAIDNSRETVDASGRILGIVPPPGPPAGAEDKILRAALLPELFVLETAEYRAREEERPDIVYAAGVDLALEIVTPIRNAPVVDRRVESPDDPALDSLAAAQPTRTMAGSPRRPGDVINVLLIGAESEIADAFREAGWTTAVALSLRADVRTVIAVAEDRGYAAGPVSQEWVDDKLPDLVFQKQNDTFAKRHHIRLWARPGEWRGKRVWVGAATHDIGVKFVREERTFTHRIDSQIDFERQKIVDDLSFTGRFAPPSLIARPAVPRRSSNATDDVMETDGRIAVLIVKTQ